MVLGSLALLLMRVMISISDLICRVDDTLCVPYVAARSRLTLRLGLRLAGALSADLNADANRLILLRLSWWRLTLLNGGRVILCFFSHLG